MFACFLLQSETNFVMNLFVKLEEKTIICPPNHSIRALYQYSRVVLLFVVDLHEKCHPSCCFDRFVVSDTNISSTLVPVAFLLLETWTQTKP
mmetsp:Transcript_117207/g.239815  ORF Transcript_117207/g.239815 Transcript_117207/m.239815 type:complete len:92 (-) Transcript_117207:170-445(-)